MQAKERAAKSCSGHEKDELVYPNEQGELMIFACTVKLWTRTAGNQCY